MKKPTKGKPAKKQPNDYPRVTVRLGAALLDRLVSECKAKHMSRGQIITLALRKYLPELKKVNL